MSEFQYTHIRVEKNWPFYQVCQIFLEKVLLEGEYFSKLSVKEQLLIGDYIYFIKIGGSVWNF